MSPLHFSAAKTPDASRSVRETFHGLQFISLWAQPVLWQTSSQRNMKKVAQPPVFKENETQSYSFSLL